MRLLPPEIWIALRSDIDLKEYEDEDAAAIRAGDIAVYDVAIIEPRTDENWDEPKEWTFLDSCGNYFGNPGQDNVYSHPRQISDENLRFYVIDMWMFNLGIRQGDLIHYGGKVHAVLGLECEPYDMDAVGYATGYLVCRPAAGGALVRVSAENATRRVLELT
ncbi:hypothetical protein DMB38_20510 [Streptomyces sp. WAC 06738]|uniref:hypothetical protein n=1 Tax=Streptomyces sp. WAC 06738 TaxID=2203210 RepID=UPI000F6F9320|nr:hypothetical protein [Streptomyces sp. WAC 06738]AZM47853.1 hypothetical protein DMB38_20510 [Streptomyces sp. WAC 06738]